MTLLPVLTSMALLAQGPISLEFQGPLKDALKEIAVKGHINVVVAGDLSEAVQVNLSDVSAEEALETVAKVYHLEITRQGKLWILRERHDSAVPAPPAVPSAPAAPAPAATQVEPTDETSTAEEPSSPAEIAQAAAEKIREEAEAARERAEELREKAQELALAKKEQAAALREVAKAHAEIEQNKVSAGGPVHVEANTKVDSAIAYGGPVIIEPNAVVEGDAVAFGGNVELKANSVVEGDAVAFGGTVIKGPNAIVKGETVSMGGSAIGSAISGAVVKSERAKDRHKDSSDSSSSGKGFAFFLLRFALFFGLGFVLMMFAPQRMKAIEATIRAEPLKNGMAGLLGLFAAIPATLLLVLTLVGIPVAVLLWVAVSLFIPVGLAAVANTVGRVLPTGPLRKTQALVLAVGLLALMLVETIPVLGVLVILAATFVSAGAIIRTRFGQPPRGTPVLESEPSGATV